MLAWWMSMALVTAPPVVAIDAGHGGAHEGAWGVCGVLEKDITWALARQAADILTATRLARPYLVRQGDETLALEARAARANAAGAVLFVSIHANASPNPGAHGVETFFLSNRAAHGRLASLAERENEGIDFAEVAATDDAVQLVLRGLSLDAAHAESQQLALTTQQTLQRRLRARGRGVLQAPFVVLLGTQMAAVLVEVGFLTHPEECVRLTRPAYQEQVAQALASSILAHLATDGRVLARQDAALP
jgi:N-acetylmuramoyl-L-alanine amidase